MKQWHLLILSFFFFVSGNSAAETVLVGIEGNKIPLSQLKGKWVLINYWASWCQPCLDEINDLNQFYQHKPENLELFAVNFDQLPVNQQISLIKKFNIQYPSLSVNPGPQLGLGNLVGVPATFIFAPNGKLVDTLYGGQTLSSLKQALAAIS